MVMCFSKFGPHFKMVKSERAKKENKFVENCLNLTFTCLHFALDGGQSQLRQNFHQHHPCASTFFVI